MRSIVIENTYHGWQLGKWFFKVHRDRNECVWILSSLCFSTVLTTLCNRPTTMVVWSKRSVKGVRLLQAFNLYSYNSTCADGLMTNAQKKGPYRFIIDFDGIYEYTYVTMYRCQGRLWFFTQDWEANIYSYIYLYRILNTYIIYLCT